MLPSFSRSQKPSPLSTTWPLRTTLLVAANVAAALVVALIILLLASLC